MLKIPSKHSVSNYVSISGWLKCSAVSFWNSVPNKFVKPHPARLKFLFVCGCGHSGTTLTAAKIGNHSRFFLIGRETSAFDQLIGLHCARKIVAEWEYFAFSDKKSVVLEKTPKHVHSIPKIQKVLPDSKIIVLVRNPLDNVASLYKRFGHLDGCVCRWISDNCASLRYQDLAGVNLVRYEELVSNPEVIFRELIEFAGFEWDESVLRPGQTSYESIEQEGNMAVRADQVNKPIGSNIGGWRKVFSDEQADYVLRRARHVAMKLGYSTRIEDYL